MYVSTNVMGRMMVLEKPGLRNPLFDKEVLQSCSVASCSKGKVNPNGRLTHFEEFWKQHVGSCSSSLNKHLFERNGAEGSQSSDHVPRSMERGRAC